MAGRWHSGGEDSTVRLWDTLTGRELVSLPGHIDPVTSLAFSADGKTLVSASKDGTVWVWDVVERKGRPIQGKVGSITSIAFAPNGHELAWVGDDRKVQLFDLSNNNRREFEGHTSSLRSLAFSRDGRILASAGFDSTVRLWEVSTGTELARLKGHTGTVTSMAFAPSGEMIVSAGDDGTVRIWDVSLKRELTRFEPQTGPIWSVALSKNGMTIAAAGEGKSIRIWDVNTTRELMRLEGHVDETLCVSFSPDGRMLASAGADGIIRVWDLPSKRELTRLVGGQAIWSIAFAPDRRTLASGSDDGTVRLWDLRTSREIATLKGQKGAVFSIAFSRDGKTVASGGSDSIVRIWDVATRIEVDFKGHLDSVRSVAFAPNNQLLASASDDTTARIWDIATRREVKSLQHSGAVRAVGFTHDGETLATGEFDGRVHLWDMFTKRKVRQLYNHAAVRSLGFSPDDRTIASSGVGGIVRLWDMNSGKEVIAFDHHTSVVWSIAFSPVDNILASAGSDGTTRIWDFITTKPVGVAMGGARHTWLYCDEVDRSCFRADDGSLVVEKSYSGRIVSKIPQVNFGRVLVLTNPPASIELTEGQIVPIRVRIATVDDRASYWIRMFGRQIDQGSSSTMLTIGSSAVVQQLRHGGGSSNDGVEVEVLVSVSTPRINPQPGHSKIKLFVTSAEQDMIELPVVTINSFVAMPVITDATLGPARKRERALVASVGNVGKSSIKAPVIEWTVLGSGKRVAFNRPLEPGAKTPLSLVLEPKAADVNNVKLLARIFDYQHPVHEWNLNVPVQVIRTGNLLALIAVIMSLFFLSGFVVYWRLYRHPLLVRLSYTPTSLLDLSVEELPAAWRLLRLTGRLATVVRRAETTAEWMSTATTLVRCNDVRESIRVLARRLENQDQTKTVVLDDEVITCRLRLPEEFPLSVPYCVIMSATPRVTGADILAAWRRADIRDTVTIIVSMDEEQRRQLTRMLDEKTDMVVIPRGVDITRLFLTPNPLDTLATLIAGRVSLARISPYQINEGLRRDTVFFGRVRELTHILNRDFANYIVLGGRQLGKSSLLKAIERRIAVRGDIAAEYRVVGDEPLKSVLARAAGLAENSSLSEIAAMFRRRPGGHPRLLLLDEADMFVQEDSRSDRPFQVLDALRALSAEGHCFFILAGFWKLYEMAHSDYFAPLRNFGESLTLGPLEPEACRDLLVKPMAKLGITYSDSELIGQIISATGRRPNLVQIVCTEVIRGLGRRRVIELPDVRTALDSWAVTQALEGWGQFTTDKQAARLDRVIVWAMLEEESFDHGTVLARLQGLSFPVSAAQLRLALNRLELAFIVFEEGGTYRWRVPLFRERRRRESPEQQLHDLLGSL